jgi:hypothetical protein
MRGDDRRGEERRREGLLNGAAVAALPSRHIRHQGTNWYGTTLTVAYEVTVRTA